MAVVRAWKQVAGTLARLKRETGGAMLPILAVGLFAMILSVGAAIDLARLYIAQSQMQAGVDAAALAGANAFDNDSEDATTGRRQQIISYYKENFPNGYMSTQAPAAGSPIADTQTLLEPVFETVNGISRTTVRARGTVPMTFMALGGITSRQIAAVAKAEFQPHPLEVQVVLDNTGSMQETVNGVTKINALKAAMHSFINVLYQGGNDPQPMLALGIINYTNVVNVGSILRQYSIPIENMPGFTDQAVSWQAGNALAWKGCVVNDDSITNMSTNLATREADALDIWNVLPGERPAGSTRTMRPIRPHFSPPAWFQRNTGASVTSPTSDFYRTTGDVNLYPNNSATLLALANTSTYKRYFYRYYIGLNNGSGNMSDDVIVRTDGSYYNPSASDAFDWTDGSGRDFQVRTWLLPNLSSYRTPNWYEVTSNNEPLPSPNWQCPEAGLPIRYNVSRQTYDDFIDDRVWGILPANGTVHHAGMIWGWRLLSRYRTFTRTPPANAGTPNRALVFMTDGNTVVPDGDRRFHFYGTTEDRTISPNQDPGSVMNASDLRFSKICAIANSTTFADSGKRPMIFVVAINSGSAISGGAQTMLRNCGTSGYWLSTSSTQLSDAFTQIGRTLIDVHLTQ